jgi:hypothetical protein
MSTIYDDPAYIQFVDDSRDKFWNNTRHAYTYDLQIYGDDNHFVLWLPDSLDFIEDDFKSMHRRKAIFETLEQGEIWEWLCEVHEEIQYLQPQAN